ncbi:MAG: oxidoreductase [Actinomycetota bacterium]|nr:oxidoreductase [Actinomycetota bacterium]
MPPRQPSNDPLAGLLRLDGVAAAAAEAVAAIDRLLAHRVLRTSSAAVSTESALRGARASAALDGEAVALRELRAGAGGPVVRGALRVSSELGSLVGTWSRAPLQALARLHLLAAAELTEPGLLGRPDAAPAADMRLHALTGLLTGGTAAPAVVVAAVVHGELLDARPFPAANGVVARAAARLTLIARGLDPKAVSVPEVGHLELASSYVDSAAGYATGEPAAVAGWLKHCSAAVVLGAREGLAVCEAAQRG